MFLFYAILRILFFFFLIIYSYSFSSSSSTNSPLAFPPHCPFCLVLYPPMHSFIHPSILSSINTPIHPSNHRSIHPSIDSSMIRPSVHPFVRPSIHPSIHPSIFIIAFLFSRFISLLYLCSLFLLSPFRLSLVISTVSSSSFNFVFISLRTPSHSLHLNIISPHSLSS